MDIIGATPSVSGALDTAGCFFPLDSLPQVFTRDSGGNILQIVANNGKTTWTQTYTYSNGYVASVSGWVKGLAA